MSGDGHLNKLLLNDKDIKALAFFVSMPSYNKFWELWISQSSITQAFCNNSFSTSFINRNPPVCDRELIGCLKNINVVGLFGLRRFALAQFARTILHFMGERLLLECVRNHAESVNLYTRLRELSKTSLLGECLYSMSVAIINWKPRRRKNAPIVLSRVISLFFMSFLCMEILCSNTTVQRSYTAVHGRQRLCYVDSVT